MKSSNVSSRKWREANMAPLALPTPSDDLGESVRLRVAAFVRSLRSNGFTVGLAESQDALRIFCAIEPTNKPVLLAALRALFASHRSDWERFDAIFNAFWFAHGTKG